jgi:hypothetical protein
MDYPKFLNDNYTTMNPTHHEGDDYLKNNNNKLEKKNSFN